MSGRLDLSRKVSGEGADAVRKRLLARLAAYTKRDTILYAAGVANKLFPIPQQVITINPNDIQGLMSSLRGLKGDKLDLIMISQGGSGEAAEQIVNYLRAKYSHIRCIVPQNAMSAATMIACAYDSILMGKQSALGPIDPQMVVTNAQGGSTVMAAKAILEEAEQAKAEIIANPRVAPFWISKIQGLPLGFLASCDTASKRSVTLVADWLERFMHLPHDKATAAAKWLGDAADHKSHGRPISAEMARKEGLVIELLENDQKLQDKVLDVFHAAVLSLTTTKFVKIIENHAGKGEYTQVQVGMGPPAGTMPLMPLMPFGPGVPPSTPPSPVPANPTGGPRQPPIPAIPPSPVPASPAPTPSPATQPPPVSPPAASPAATRPA